MKHSKGNSLAKYGSKNEGGVGMRDFEVAHHFSIIERIGRLWKNDSIWSLWMNDRYIKNPSLMLINSKYNNLPSWREMQ